MRARDVKVGMRVRVKDTYPPGEDYDGELNGREGVVISGGDRDYAYVSFEGWLHGWSDREHRSCCWAISPKYLEAASEVVAIKKSRGQAYLGNGKHQWEAVVPAQQMEEHIRPTWRLRVPGGWLYKVGTYEPPVFVKMPEVVKHKV